MKLKQFRVTNFKSIVDITIEFQRSKGLWHITAGGTGNNVGKTALLEALQIHFTNVSNNNYRKHLRTGESTFTTELIDWDGNVTKLSRGADDYYEWEINGNYERANKTNGKVPEELVKYFNLYIETEKTNQIVNFRTNEVPRLFTKTTEGDNFMLLQKALGTEDYTLANRKTKKMRNEVNDNIKVVKKQLIQETEDNEFYKTQHFNLEEDIEKIDTIKNNVDTLMLKYNKIDNVLGTITKIEDITTYIDEATSGIGSINVVAIKKDIEMLAQLEKLVKIQEDIDEKQEIIDKYDNFSVDNIEELKQKILKLEKLNQLIELEDKVSIVEEEISKYTNIVGDFDTKELVTKIKKLDKINTVLKVATDFSKENKEYKQLVVKKDNASDVLKEFKEGFDVCPFCEQEIAHVH